MIEVIFHTSRNTDFMTFQETGERIESVWEGILTGVLEVRDQYLLEHNTSFDNLNKEEYSIIVSSIELSH